MFLIFIFLNKLFKEINEILFLFLKNSNLYKGEYLKKYLKKKLKKFEREIERVKIIISNPIMFFKKISKNKFIEIPKTNFQSIKS